MYPNHQGKYDVFGIISAYKQPCTFVIDIKKSNAIFIKEVVDVMGAKRLDKQNNRQDWKNKNECTLFTTYFL